jgi:hypothetical protein
MNRGRGTRKLYAEEELTRKGKATRRIRLSKNVNERRK